MAITPDIYTHNINNRVITSDMLADALTYIKRRAGSNGLNERLKKQEETILSVIDPVCVCKRQTGFKTVKITNARPAWDMIFVREALKGTITRCEGELNVPDPGFVGDVFAEGLPFADTALDDSSWFFEYCEPDSPEFEYSICYSVSGRFFLCPVTDPNAYPDLPVVITGKRVRSVSASDVQVSSGFVTALCDLISSGEYKLELAPSLIPSGRSEEKPFAPDFSVAASVGMDILAEYFERRIHPSVPKLRVGLSERRRTELKREAEARFWKMDANIRRRQENGVWQGKEPSLACILPDKPSVKFRIDRRELRYYLGKLVPIDTDTCTDLVADRFDGIRFEAAVARALSEYEYVTENAGKWHKEFVKAKRKRDSRTGTATYMR